MTTCLSVGTGYGLVLIPARHQAGVITDISAGAGLNGREMTDDRHSRPSQN